jgi:hypothetical protein
MIHARMPPHSAFSFSGSATSRSAPGIRAALLQCLWRLRRLRCADTKSTFIVLACLLNAIFTHYLPAGPVKVANGGHLSGTKKQVAGYDKNSWLLPWFENRRKELANRPLIRDQAFGDALDPNKLERLGRYEVHLDRKLERMLTMLLRQGPAAYYRRELIRLAKRSFMGRSLVGGPCSSFWL